MRRSPVWTEAETTYLVANLNTLSVKQIAEYLNRSAFSVYTKIGNLGRKS